MSNKLASETSNVYKNMADWVDKQISKLVLGQTMTTDNGASLAQSKTHEEVRQDIADNDVMQIVDTFNAALVVPYITLNFGEQAEYPKIDLFKPDEKNIEQIISAVEKLGPQGLKVKADELRSLIGLSNPEADDEVIGGRPAYTPPENDSAKVDDEAAAKNVALNAEQEGADAVDALIDESGYIEISDDIATVIEKAAADSTDFVSFQKELQKLVTGWAPDKIAECIAVATFKAHAKGAADFSEE
ncbi:hypothetical protein AGMMS49579_21270 [Spirochaetia bacterium]|nr:hypothetical protein AGMMS49579_21270 [Spirochaetia bacterium]